MTRGLAMALVAMAATAGVDPAASTRAALPQQQLPTFRSGTDIVAVDVSIRDGTRVVTGLTAGDFELLDNGVPQRVSDVSYGKVPIDITVALDVSASLTGPLLDQLRRALLQLMRDLEPADRLKLMTFNMRVQRVVDFTTDASAVERAVVAALPGGATSIWDAISVALVSAADPDRRQLVVVFTDTVDSSSISDPDQLLDLARRTRAALTVVVPTSQNPGRVVVLPAESRAALSRVVRETGGTFLSVSGDIAETFRRALDEFRSSYVLYFTPTGVERAGFHTLSVVVKGRKSVTIRARRGYFWQ